MSIHMWLLIAVAAITYYFGRTDTSRRGKLRCVQTITVLLTCFSGLRSWRMGDVYHYCYAFRACQAEDWVMDWTSHDTVGMQLLFRSVGKLGLGFEVCLFLIAAFAAVTLGILVFRYSSSPALSYLLYLGLGNYIFTFTGLKQTIAMGFVTLAMIAIFEERPWKFLVFTLVAGLFHIPALIFLPAYAIARKRIDLVYFLICAAVLYLLYNYREQIVGYVTDLYYEDELQFAAEEQVGGKFLMMVVILTAAAVIRPVKNYDYDYRCLFNIMFVAAVLQSASVYDNVFTRLADYYFQFFVVFLPYMLEPGTLQAMEHPGHRRQIRYWPPKYYSVAKMVILVGLVLFYSQTLKGASTILNEFHFFWQPDPAGAVPQMFFMGG